MRSCRRKSDTELVADAEVAEGTPYNFYFEPFVPAVWGADIDTIIVESLSRRRRSRIQSPTRSAMHISDTQPQCNAAYSKRSREFQGRPSSGRFGYACQIF